MRPGELLPCARSKSDKSASVSKSPFTSLAMTKSCATLRGSVGVLLVLVALASRNATYHYGDALPQLYSSDAGNYAQCRPKHRSSCGVVALMMSCPCRRLAPAAARALSFHCDTIAIIDHVCNGTIGWSWHALPWNLSSLTWVGHNIE